MRYKILLVTLLIVSLQSNGQTGIGTNTPSTHAILDVHSTYKGVLLPRLNTAQQAALDSVLTTAQAGMLVLDSASGKIIYFTGDKDTSWKDLSNSAIVADGPLSISHINDIALNAGTAAGDLITWDGANWVNMQPAVDHFSISEDNHQPSLTLNFSIALVGIYPSRNDLPFLSEIQLFSFAFPPKGYAFCNGQLLSIAQNVALFSLLGTTYGGNGQTNFALPDLRGRVPVHYGSGQGLLPYALGEKAGLEQNTITR